MECQFAIRTEHRNCSGHAFENVGVGRDLLPQSCFGIVLPRQIRSRARNSPALQRRKTEGKSPASACDHCKPCRLDRLIACLGRGGKIALRTLKCRIARVSCLFIHPRQREKCAIDESQNKIVVTNPDRNRNRVQRAAEIQRLDGLRLLVEKQQQTSPRGPAADYDGAAIRRAAGQRKWRALAVQRFQCGIQRRRVLAGHALLE